MFINHATIGIIMTTGNILQHQKILANIANAILFHVALILEAQKYSRALIEGSNL